jgi:hypothetical protein
MHRNDTHERTQRCEAFCKSSAGIRHLGLTVADVVIIRWSSAARLTYLIFRTKERCRAKSVEHLFEEAER